MTTIDNNNYELWLLRYAEGELSASERQAVEAWLVDHSEAADELTLYNDAPRLQRDPSVTYVAAMPQPSQSLWPALLRWSAAAAVLLILMVPALRMGDMEVLEAPQVPLTAKADVTDSIGIIKLPEARERNTSRIHREYVAVADPLATPITPDTPAVHVAPPTIIETNTLIVCENAPEEADPIVSNSLIAFDRSSDWGDILLAANEAYREILNERPLGRMVSRALPDSRQLEENVVAPLRERIDNMKNKRK